MEFASPEAFAEYARGQGRSYARLTLSQGEAVLGSMLIELYTDITPATCQHFTAGIQGKFQSGYKVRGGQWGRAPATASSTARSMPRRACAACGAAAAAAAAAVPCCASRPAPHPLPLTVQGLSHP